MKSAQVGFTKAAINWIGYVIHHAPGPMLAVQPTVELAKRFSRQRIEPLIAESPALRERVKPSRARDAGNTVLSKEFPAGLLIITGANSAVGLRSMPARYLFLDEVDAYPPSADEEGDPVALAEARTRTFSWRSQGSARIDADDPRHLADRAGVRGVGPAPLLRAVPALRAHAVASVRAAALGQGEARDHTLYMCGLRRPDRGTPQDGDAAGRRVASHRGRRRSRHDRVPSLGTLFAGRLVLLGRHRPDVGGRAGHRRGQAQLQERRAGPDLGRDRRGAGLAAALRAARDLADRHRAEGRAVPHRRRRRAEGPHRGRCLGLGSRARKLAGRSHRHRWRARARRDLGRAQPPARSNLAACARRAARPRQACDRHRLRDRPPSTPGRAAPVTRRSRRSRASRASTARRR